MVKIITTAEAQKHISLISREIEKTSFIVTSHGKGKMVVLPYFDGCNQHISDYQEDYEMAQNATTLRKRYQTSSESGTGNLKI